MDIISQAIVVRAVRSAGLPISPRPAGEQRDQSAKLIGFRRAAKAIKPAQ
jgi:hypothetical protein